MARKRFMYWINNNQDFDDFCKIFFDAESFSFSCSFIRNVVFVSTLCSPCINHPLATVLTSREHYLNKPFFMAIYKITFIFYSPQQRLENRWTVGWDLIVLYVKRIGKKMQRNITLIIWAFFGIGASLRNL